MSLDLLAIADAVAAKFGAVTAPTGYDPIVGATARTPNNIPGTPFVAVELPASDEITVSTGRRDGVHDFDVYFLMDRATAALEIDKERLLKWLPGLLDATYSGLKLGLLTVKKSYVVEYEYGQYSYGGNEYHAWHLVVRVWTEDSITLAAGAAS